MAFSPHLFFLLRRREPGTPCIRRIFDSRNHTWHRTALLSSALPLFFALLLSTAAGTAARAQEPPYFVTYSQVLEEPGNLEIAQKGLTGAPKDSNAFYSSTLELE